MSNAPNGDELIRELVRQGFEDLWQELQEFRLRYRAMQHVPGVGQLPELHRLFELIEAAAKHPRGGEGETPDFLRAVMAEIDAILKDHETRE